MKSILRTGLLALFATACGEFPMLTAGDSGTPVDAGVTTSGGSCTSDTNCSSTQLCHPVLKHCIDGCVKGADCASGVCARFDGTPGSTYAPGFCQCSTDAICAADGGSSICQGATLRCEAPCTSTSCPSGLSCDSASGQCKVPVDGGVDAGMDAGVTDAGVACNSTHAQPDTCGYGQACNGVMTCDPARNDTCANITQAISKSNYSAWNAATSTGPVIYTFVDEADVAADCGGGTSPFTVTLYAYAGTSIFPAASTALPGFWYFDASGNKTDIALSLLRPSHYVVATDGKTMSANFTLCAAAGATTLQAAFAFTGGNAVCATLVH